MTDATDTADTVTPAWPMTPSLVPRMFAVPTETAVTVPDALTVATLALSELQVTARPVSTLFDASRVTADALVV